MSVFYHNDDPLLHKSTVSLFNTSQPVQQTNINDAYSQLYKQQIMMEMQQQQAQSKDWLGDLDNAMKSLDQATVDKLNSNQEYGALVANLQEQIQAEIMLLVKFKLNNNPNTIENVKRQMALIDSMTMEVKKEEKQSLNEINDYIKNYSHLSFDEYRQLKYGKPNQQQTFSETVVVNEEKKTKKTTKN